MIMGAKDFQLWRLDDGLDDDESWDGGNRRRSPRMYIPTKTLYLDIDSPRGKSLSLEVTNLSRTGIGGHMKQGHPLQEGVCVTIRHADALSFAGKVARVGVMDIGIVSEDKSALEYLTELMRKEKVTFLHHRNDELYVEGYLGYAAHAEMRKARKFSRIDIERVTGMDSLGLGILMHHNSKGTKISGCKGKVRALLNGFRFCEACNPHNPPTDCPAYARTQVQKQDLGGKSSRDVFFKTR
jgi:hypothetical protein